MNNLLAPLNTLGRLAPFDTLSKAGNRLLDDPTVHLLHRLDALMLVLKTCKGATCADPYSKLLPPHPNHKLSGFTQLLRPDLDNYFSRLPKVSFKACGLGYHRALEQPEWDDAWSPRSLEWRTGEESGQHFFPGG